MTHLVFGEVICAGEPVTTGLVSLVPKGHGRTASGKIGTDGRYELQAAAGTYKVVVVAIEEMATENVNRDNWVAAFRQQTKSYVPSEYGDPETSPLAITVEASNGISFDIDIPSHPPR